MYRQFYDLFRTAKNVYKSKDASSISNIIYKGLAIIFDKVYHSTFLHTLFHYRFVVKSLFVKILLN